jgi:hypothetical protein
MLAVERFVKGGGWVEIVILGAYAFIVSRAIRNEKVRWFTA